MSDLPRVNKPDYIRELGPVDLGSLKSITAKVSEQVWNQENAMKENDFECFHHTRHIIFRFIEGMIDPRRFYATPAWNVWQPILRPIMMQIVTPYNFTKPEFPKAMLARLEAGHIIDRHVDGAGSNPLVHKIHIPLQTNEKALLHIKDKSFHLAQGFGYEVNNLKPHGVENYGDEDRIHFIFEVFDAALGEKT